MVLHVFSALLGSLLKQSVTAFPCSSVFHILTIHIAVLSSYTCHYMTKKNVKY
jgi:hypothetical protein